MASTVAGSDSPKEQVDAAEIRQELDRIASSPVFRGRKRCQSFIQYVVTKTLEGDSGTLKERTLAIEVFGRDEPADLANDSIVRVGAREVRKRLAQYYVDEGAHDAIRIELPAGSYIPSFHHQPLHKQQASPNGAPAAEPVASPNVETGKLETSPEETAGLTRKRKLLLLALAAASLSVAGVFAWQLLPVAYSPFATFWKPFFQSDVRPVIFIAHPIVYQPSSRASHLDEQLNGISQVPAQRAIHVAPNLLDGSDYVPSINQFVGFGDAQAALSLTSLLLKHHVAAGVRLASRVDFYDLRQARAILIGAFTNRWVMELTKSMRYRFAYRDGKPCVEEGSLGCRWILSKTDNGKSTEDYILICRLPHPQTGGFVLIIAGLNLYGTEEAGRIVSDPEALQPMLKRLPPHWADRNLQLVLHVSVIGDSPAQSELVSMHAW